MRLTPAAVKALAQCRSIVGGESDPFGSVWRDMSAHERIFWLLYSRQKTTLSDLAWSALPGDTRAHVKNSIYRGFKRMQVLAAVIDSTGVKH